MDIKSTPTYLIVAYITSQLTSDREVTDFVQLFKMTDSEKAAAMISFLQARVNANTSQINGMSDAIAAANTVLSSDNSTCNNAIASLGG